MAIPYIYYPTIKLGPITIFTWGLFTALAFLVAILLIVRYGKKIGLKEDNAYGICFYILLGAIIGSRLLFVISNLSIFTADPLEVFRVWHGGMDFLGGLAGGILGAFIFVKIKKLRLGVYFDLVAPYIALGHAIGRIGCILGDGGHLGKPTNLPWGIVHEGVARHPGAFYEMLVLIVLFFVLIQLRKRKLEKGVLFLYYIIGYSILRFGIDFLRADPTYYGLTGTQWGVILAAIISVVLIARIKKKARARQPTEQKPVQETEPKPEPKPEENTEQLTTKE